MSSSDWALPRDAVGDRLTYLAEILEASTELVATTDLVGDLHYVNAAFRDRFRVNAVDGMMVERRNMFDFFTEDSRERFLRDAVPRLWKGQAWSGEIECIDPDGGPPIILWHSAITHRGPNGKPLYFSGVARDMSTIKAAEANIRASEEKFRALVAEGSDVILVVAPTGHITYASPAIGPMLGYSAETFVGTLAFDLVHPSDLDEVVERFISATTGQNDRQGTCCRVRHVDGSWRWIEMLATDHTATLGVEGIIVNARDITARQAANQELERAAALLSSVMRAAASEAIFVTDEHAQIVAFSRGAESLLGYTAEEAVGIHPIAFHLADEVAALAATLGVTSEQVFVHEPPPGQSLLREWSFVRKDGTTFDGTLTISARYETDGQLAGFLYIGADVTERRRHEALLTKAAEHDPLTELANRICLQRALGIAVEHESWHTPGRVLLFLDLDRFKGINDTFGHATGDAILVQVAQRLTDALRSEDLAVRVGGDEFVVLLSATVTLADATRIAERIVTSIGRDYVVDDNTMSIGTSIGLSCSRRDLTPEQLLLAADEATYEAKRLGRGRVVLSQK